MYLCYWFSMQHQDWICEDFTSYSVQFSLFLVWLFMTPWPAAHRFPRPSPAHGACANSCPSSQWCHPTISSCHPLLLPAFNLSQHWGIFQWFSSSHQVAKILGLQHQSFQWIFLCIRLLQNCSFEFVTTFCRENTSTTSRRQKMLSKRLLNPEAWIFMLQK